MDDCRIQGQDSAAGAARRDDRQRRPARRSGGAAQAPGGRRLPVPRARAAAMRRRRAARGVRAARAGRRDRCRRPRPASQPAAAAGAELAPDLGAFWKSVSQGPSLRALSHGAAMAGIMSLVFGEPARPQDYLFLRPAAPGRATGLHFDYPFFTRAHDRVATVWMPIGPVPVSDGPLVIVENSHRLRDLIDPMIGFDISRDSTPQGRLRQRRDQLRRAARHAAPDPRLRGRRRRPVRHVHGARLAGQPLAHRPRAAVLRRALAAAIDADRRALLRERPAGTTGVGYGELNGAKPLTQEWHVRSGPESGALRR